MAQALSSLYRSTLSLLSRLVGESDAEGVKNILKSLAPLILVELFDSLLSITDTIFVSGLGDEAIAAVGFSGYILWAFSVTLFIFFIGIMVHLSQAYGAGELSLCSRIVSENALASGAFGVALSVALLGVLDDVVGLFGGGLSHGTKGQVIEYITVRAYGFPIMAASLALDASLRAVGLNKHLMFSYIISVTTNVALDPLLIYGYLGLPPLGVRGAAAASVISQAVLLLTLLLHVFKLPFRVSPALPGRDVIKTLKIGLPGMVERLVFSLGNLAYASAISRCGDIAMAAHTIGLRVESFVYTPLFAFSTVSTSLVGQSVGRGELGEAYKRGIVISKLSAILMVALGGLLAALSPVAPRAFTDEPEVSGLATIYLVLAGLSEPGLGLAMTLSSSIRGAGNTLVPMLINVSLLFSVRVLLSYLLIDSGLMGPAVIGAWIAMFLDVYARGLAFLFIYRKYFYRLARRLV